MTALPDARVLDTLPPADAVDALAPLFEGAPRFVARIVDRRPFGTWEALLLMARSIAHDMPEDEQIELIDAHPRLGAAPGSLSALSFAEQGHDRDAGPTADDGRRPAADGPPAPDGPPAADGPPADAPVAQDRITRELERLNDAYEAKFGFRYCVFVAGRPHAALIPGFEAALEADRRSELHRALDAVIDIAAARVAALRA